MKCDICQVNEADGFLAYYYTDTGETLTDRMGPNVCEPCAITMCDGDTTTLDDLEQA
ncbi:MAG: hypothetical protein ACXABY_11500 [Candidatus Thorarchaeota archaeon]|jgi:hypothetical protein